MSLLDSGGEDREGKRERERVEEWPVVIELQGPAAQGFHAHVLCGLTSQLSSRSRNILIIIGLSHRFPQGFWCEEDVKTCGKLLIGQNKLISQNHKILIPVHSYFFSPVTPVVGHTLTPPPSVSSPDVHPDGHADRLPQPQRLRLSGHALHAKSLHHHFPPWAERPQTQAQLQGHRHRRHHDQQAVTAGSRAAQRGGEDGAVRGRGGQRWVEEGPVRMF